MSLHMRALFLRLMVLLLCLPLQAHAQFQKTPWPAKQAAPALELTDLQGQHWTSASLKGRAVVLNFWATWCPPCVKEIPEINELHEAQKALGAKGCQVLGLAIDGPTPVREFVAKTPVKYPLGLAGFGGTELAKALGNTSGGLPFTVLIDAKGRVRQRKMGATTLKEMQGWLAKL